jgi:chromosome segregation ATPase
MTNESNPSWFAIMGLAVAIIIPTMGGVITIGMVLQSINQQRLQIEVIERTMAAQNARDADLSERMTRLEGSVTSIDTELKSAVVNIGRLTDKVGQSRDQIFAHVRDTDTANQNRQLQLYNDIAALRTLIAELRVEIRQLREQGRPTPTPSSAPIISLSQNPLALPR